MNSANTKLLHAFVFLLLLSGCGGGGGGGGVSPPPPPPPPPPPGVLVPQIFIEHDPNGAPYVRVLEQIYDAFAPGAPARTFSDLTASPGDIDGSQSTLVTNVHVSNEKYGLHIIGSALVSIYDYSSVGFNGGGSIHGASIKLERSAPGPTYIQRAFGDEQQTPDPTYTVANVDFLGVELTSQPIYMRGATGRNLGDAGVDTKSAPVYLMNVTIDNANRALRAWDGVDITVVNSIMNVQPTFEQAWVYDNTSSIHYYNTLWCVGSADPNPGDPNCTHDPTIVSGETISSSAAMARMIALSSNPLPAVSPFFATQIDQIVVEYSSDNGATWQTMTLPNAGGGGLPEPVGDTRYRIPFDLNSGTYVFRASFRKNGVMVGSFSSIINEAGQVVG